MKIVVDQNIPLAQELFSDIGELVTLPGRDMRAIDLVDADILLVRSVTKVNKALIAGSNIKFVGSCTIGFDHLDTAYLDGCKITWTNAPGCNANAVVQYVFSAMAALRPHWQQQKVGIIGCGNIGGRLYQRFKKLGIHVVVYDPFLSAGDCENLVSLDEVLQSDIITCHTPLTHEGLFPTYHLLSRNQLAQIPSDTLLINSGRGPVIDNQALLDELKRRPVSVVLDVWENEPNIDRELLNKVMLATPHIAGYSLEGKEQGSYMIYQALCKYLKQPMSDLKKQFLSKDKSLLSIAASKSSLDEAGFDQTESQLNDLLLACYDIRHDDKDLRHNENFDLLRKQYLSRRECSHFELPESFHNTSLAKRFKIIQGI